MVHKQGSKPYFIKV